jgi:hypothetical protein
MVSVTFTWDRAEGERLARAWGAYHPTTIGGPAYDDAGGEFVPGLFLKPGYTITSRGCPRGCGFCFVPRREGHLRELPLVPGYDVLDNNLLACSDSHLDRVFAMLAAQPLRTRFSGGLDPVLITEMAIERLKSLRLECLWTAYDSEADRKPALEAIRRLRTAGLSRQKTGCYVLVGYPGDTFEAAQARVDEVIASGGQPFAMLFRNADGDLPPYAWRRWVKYRIRPAAMFPKPPVADNSKMQRLLT